MKSLAPSCVDERCSASPRSETWQLIPGPQLECSAVTKFGIEFSLDNIQYVSVIATVIRRIASAIFDQARPQLANGEGAPGGLSRLAEMESMWAPEHSHIPVPRGTPFPGGGDVPKPYYEVMDPFVVPSSQSTAWRRASRRALRCGQPACAGRGRRRHGLGEHLCMRR